MSLFQTNDAQSHRFLAMICEEVYVNLQHKGILYIINNITGIVGSWNNSVYIYISLSVIFDIVWSLTSLLWLNNIFCILFHALK